MWSACDEASFIYYLLFYNNKTIIIFIEKQTQEEWLNF